MSPLSSGQYLVCQGLQNIEQASQLSDGLLKVFKKIVEAKEKDTSFLGVDALIQYIII